MNRRIVITGIGVIAPNALGKEDFNTALQEGRSGIQFWPELEKLNLRCQIGGVPPLTEEYKKKWLPDLVVKKLSNKAIMYACLSGMEAWSDAGLEVNAENTDYSSGMVFGAGDLGFDSLTKEYPSYPIDRGESRRLGSRTITECMNSGGAAYLNEMLGLGNRVLSNSAACITGSEAVLLGYDHLMSGRADRMICGSTEGDGRYIWSAFDAMRVLCGDSNNNPEFGPRPMSDSSSGFVPSGGSGAMVLETLDSAKQRNAKIYAEVLGGHSNSGGLRNGGSMTAPNSAGVVSCIKGAIENSGISPDEIDLISGHLTSTKGDPLEIKNWTEALGKSGQDFPLINTPKSMIGHAVAGAGSVELVASLLQMEHGYVHPNLNVDNLHPEILNLIDASRIPTKTVKKDIKTVVKANFGFGDLNCCLVLRKWED